MDFSNFTRSDWIACTAVSIALVSAIFTGLNYRVSARKERRDLGDVEPLIEFDLGPGQRPGNPWRKLTLTVHNRAQHRIYLKGIAAGSIPAEILFTKADADGDQIDLAAKAEAARPSFRLGDIVEPAATAVISVQVAFVGGANIAFPELQWETRVGHTRSHRHGMMLKRG